MARVRNNQGNRKKILDVFIRPFLEQENTQEREAYLQARETVKPLQDKTWELASKIVGRFYTPKDVSNGISFAEQISKCKILLQKIVAFILGI